MDKNKHWDLVVIGAGVAGFTGGIYGARSGLKTLILEEKVPGGTTADAPLIENYPGFPKGISGMELTRRMLEHAKRMGVEIHQLEKATKLEVEDDEKRVITDKIVYSVSAVILAMGTRYKKLGQPGEDEYRGRGVSYCAVCDGPFFKGKRVVVVGGGNAAGVSAIYLANLASDVKLIHRRSQLRAEEVHFKELQDQNVEILWNTEVKEIKGKEKVECIILFNNKTKKIMELKVDGVFVQIGETPNSAIAKDAGVKLDRDGYIVVDQRQRTNLQGVYAAGDVTTCPVKQVGTAVGQAIIAATEAFGYIKRPYYFKG